MGESNERRPLRRKITAIIHKYKAGIFARFFWLQDFQKVNISNYKGVIGMMR